MLLPCNGIEMTHTAACESISGNGEQKHTQKRFSITGVRGLVQISFSARAVLAQFSRSACGLVGRDALGEPAMRRRKIASRERRRAEKPARQNRGSRALDTQKMEPKLSTIGANGETVACWNRKSAQELGRGICSAGIANRKS